MNPIHVAPHAAAPPFAPAASADEPPPTRRSGAMRAARALDDEPTVVIPAAWLERLRAESCPLSSPRPEAPRIEIVELDPDDVVVVDEPPSSPNAASDDIEVCLDAAFPRA